MFTYMNKVTGTVIQTHGRVNGSNWELVEEPKKKDSKKPGKSEKEAAAEEAKDTE